MLSALPLKGPGRLSRRIFLRVAGAFAAAPVLGQGTRVSVASMEHDRVLQEAKSATDRPVRTLRDAPAPAAFAASAHDFASNPGTQDARRVGEQAAFRGHANLLREFRDTVACLTAAFVLTHEDRYAQRASLHLRAWFVTAETRMQPEPLLSGMVFRAGSPAKQTSGFIMDLVPLAELARAVSFLTDSSALGGDELAAMNAWFAALLEWLNTEQVALLARDAKDHRASAWLLLGGALSRATRNEARLDQCRHRLRTPTLRNQLTADGIFPQELDTPTPYRNTLMNFDLLCTACELLASTFDPIWTYDLQDGPGLRSMAAFVAPVVRDPAKWPYVADDRHFRDLPGRRHGLLFAGRAYQRQEYIDLWQSTPPLIADEIADTFPIRQPLLFTTRAAHGL